jgi:CheY-like chemotaxis protein
VNLSVNARDAMPHGGKLTFETTDVTFDDELESRQAVVAPGRYVKLAVSDTGHGMTEEVKEHIFEPFFTTKNSGKGTGLGLATCYGIIKQNGGNICARSSPDEGTTIEIYLPRIEDEAREVPNRNGSKELPRGTETILLVEDEPTVRALAVQILRQQGYRVLEAATGEEALRIANHGGPEMEIHLLVTDVVMPGLGGRELVDRLEVDRPGMKVLFLSGYAGEAIAHHGILEAGLTLLQKPFSPAELARKIRELLDS